MLTNEQSYSKYDVHLNGNSEHEFRAVFCQCMLQCVIKYDTDMYMCVHSTQHFTTTHPN